ncbi:MAG: hypothetical protein VX210_18175, partial [Myxococcota bacterium]|nr:hypothetical protein [Myxococcota bacterium]
MSVVWLACSLVLSSVEWSGEAEAEASQFQTSEADAFPGHLQGFFDLASVDLVNLSTVHNRLSLFEPTRLSLHGFSWTSLRYEIDGVHLWHPLMDGEPAVALSPKRFGTMALLREHGRLPTLSYLRPKLAATSRFFVAEFVTPVVGTTLLPHGFMDREPALPTNTPRRQENSGYRVVMKEGIQQPLWNAELGVELNQSNRQFP